jgi:hypothetical protein
MPAVTESPGAIFRSVPVPPHIAAELRRTAKRMEQDKARRDELIRDAHDAGASLREIEKVAGITHVAVLKIIRRSQ